MKLLPGKVEYIQSDHINIDSVQLILKCPGFPKLTKKYCPNSSSETNKFISIIALQFNVY